MARQKKLNYQKKTIQNYYNRQSTNAEKKRNEKTMQGTKTIVLISAMQDNKKYKALIPGKDFINPLEKNKTVNRAQREMLHGLQVMMGII